MLNSLHKLQPVRGTKDLFAEEIRIFNHIISVAKKRSQNFGFEELQTPIFEFSEVFERNLGETSDIISKEVYKFPDRGDNMLTLRPEFTAGVIRALISNGELQQILPRKFFSYGPIFRYDRPQKGRQRQFHQINFEILGEENFFCDVEMILLATSILKDLGVLDKTTLEINSLGCIETKTNYERALHEYFTKLRGELSADSQTRLEKNPLRILDSKDQQDIELLADAPKISDFFSTEAKARFDAILDLLTKLNVKHHINQRLVRGLDYYTSTVFEFTMSHEGAQNAVLAGGRYDGLVEKMSGKAMPAIGFAAGIERLMLLTKFESERTRPISINYISEKEKIMAFEIAQTLRNAGFATDFVFEGNFKKQMKRASQNNSRFVVILGEEEIKNGEIVVKDFDNGTEQKVKQKLLVAYLSGKASN
ncbi:MAG: histidine--tRNA ligase [Alphaproteobacteria bacterium]|nr:histidine--tRNA ligase [Alphaproteobacteria bacterium]